MRTIERPATTARRSDRSRCRRSRAPTRLEAWLEDDDGKRPARPRRPSASTTSRPAAPSPAPAGWLAGDRAGACSRSDTLPDRLPLSGIRGYAISLDHGGGGPLRHARPSAPSPRPICRRGRRRRDLARNAARGHQLRPGRRGLRRRRRLARPATVLQVDATGRSSRLAACRAAGAAARSCSTAHATDPLSGMAAAGPAGPFTAIAVDGGRRAIALGDTAAAWVGGSGVHASTLLRPRRRRKRRRRFGRRGDARDGDGPDRRRRRRGSPSPPLRTRREPERIEATVADPLSGPSPSAGSIAVRPAGTRDPLRGAADPGHDREAARPLGFGLLPAGQVRVPRHRLRRRRQRRHRNRARQRQPDGPGQPAEEPPVVADAPRMSARPACFGGQPCCAGPGGRWRSAGAADRRSPRPSPPGADAARAARPS